MAQPLYPPGTQAPGGEPGFLQDMGTMLTNPALLLGMAGTLAPEEALMGGNYWRIGPRLRALGELFGGARAVNQEQRFGSQLQGLAQQGVMPPGQNQADPWQGKLPPGMDRQAFMAQLNPEMIRQIGQNPQYGALVGKYAEAAENNQKQAAAAQGWYDQLRHTHPEEQARSMAIAQATAGKVPDQKLAMTPAAELQTQTMRANANQKIEAALAPNDGSPGLDVNDPNQVALFLNRNRDVDETQLFSRTGNMPAAVAYSAQKVEALNKRLYPQGIHMTAEMSRDPRTGDFNMKLTEGPVPITPAQVVEGVARLQKLVMSMQDLGMPSSITQGLLLELRTVAAVPNQTTYLKLNDAILGLYGHWIAADSARDMATQTRIQGAVNSANTRLQSIEKELQSGVYQPFKSKDSARMQRQYPAEFKEMQSKQRQAMLLYQEIASMHTATNLADLNRIANEYDSKIAKEQEAIMGVNVPHPSGKTWPQVELQLRKQFTAQGMPPDRIATEIEKQKQVFLSELR